MLGLQLRDEFLGVHMPGTAIELRTSDNQGAVQKTPDYILSITYPTADVQTALSAISVGRSGRPIVIMGDRGRGKSHIMAIMHHAIQTPSIVESWMKDWGQNLNSDELKYIELLKGYFPISEPVHNYEYHLLWNLLFDRHPNGQYYRGQFEGMAQPFPPRTLLEKMFEERPTCLILDEFQTWFTGLPEKDPKTGLLIRQYAYNFIQILSEIAKDRPEILILAISVLNNQNEAFQQVHRQGPVIIDFRGPSAKQDRQRLLLHRMFKNRINIPEIDIANITGAYAGERFRLLHSNKSVADMERVKKEVYCCWPFSPELLDLIEDHILLSSAAQETRDLIRILVQVFRTRGEFVPVITPADFFVDGETNEVQTLVDSIAVQAGQERLRQIAQKNLEAARDSSAQIPNARELISSIWMRSMSPGKNIGGSPAELHLDITRNQGIDDNAFQAELTLLIEHSSNIHGDEVPGGPLWFGVNENPRSKVRASAKNNKLWHPDAAATAGLHPGKDISYIRKTLRSIFEPATTQVPSRSIVLGPKWKTEPWNDVDDADKPDKWDKPVLLVIPDQIAGGMVEINACLGLWLAKHVQKRRNTVRFLLPASDMHGLYDDPELIYTARCSFLCSREAWGADAIYWALHQDFDRPLRQVLKSRYNRFAILRKWDYQQPQKCSFEMEKITEQGESILSGVEVKIISDLFDQTEFKTYVLERAKDFDFVGSLMDDLVEPPPPNGGEAIPFLGETKTYELILAMAAEGTIVLNVSGTWIGRRPEDATSEDSLRYIRSKYRTGQEMRQIQLGLPGAVGGGTVTVPPSTVEISRPNIGSSHIPGSVTKPGDETNSGFTSTTSNGEGENYGASGTDTSPQPENFSIIKSKKYDEPAIGINLSGCFESWGVSPTQSIESARIEFSSLTVQQVKQILQRIPSAFKATLEITYKEGGPK